MELVCSERHTTDGYIFSPENSESISQQSLIKNLKISVQSLRVENELKQEAIDMASRLVQELEQQNSSLEEKHLKIIKENQQLLYMLDALAKKVDEPSPPPIIKRGISNHHQISATNHQGKLQRRTLQKERLKHKFKSFLSISVNNSSLQMFNQSCQSLSQNELLNHSPNCENDPEASNQSNMKYSKMSRNQSRLKCSRDLYQIDTLRKRLQKTEKQMNQLIRVGQQKQNRYLKTIELLNTKIKRQ